MRVQLAALILEEPKENSICPLLGFFVLVFFFHFNPFPFETKLSCLASGSQ